EKAGIIKRFTPVIIGESDRETRPVFLAKAGVEEAPLFFADELLSVKKIAQSMSEQTFQLAHNESGTTDTYQLGLSGHYQAENLRTVLCAVDALREDGWNISKTAVKNGLKKVVSNTGLLGRMQQLGQQPDILCDTAHNEAGVQAVMAQIQAINQALHIVWGMVSDKKHADILQLLPKEARYYFVKPDVPRGLDADELKEKAETMGLKGVSFDSVAAGLAAAKASAQPDDVIFIGGSTFVVAEVV
ncbi:MAG: cyanophycin synthetase, partial [Bacteroidota bacterium]